jgi:ubiquinol-cytochrome c reductase cytochrome b subunit
MIGFLARTVDNRVRASKFLRSAINHVFPDHWSFMLGEIALYSFAILVATGVFLALFFDGSSAKVIYHGSYGPLRGVEMDKALESVIHISFDVPAGLLIRQIHHWAADIFIGAILVHQARIFFTAAFRKPRELNWVVGMTLLVLAMVNGYLGYSICGDLLSGAGMRIGYSILLSVPVIGPWITFLLMGGTVPVDATIPRMFAMHIFLVPALITILIAVHLGIIWRQMHTNYPGPHRTNKTIVGSRLWPSYTLKSLGLFLLLFAVVAALGGLVQIDPVWVYGPYNPVAILPGAQPDWYLGWVEGAMRLFPGVHIASSGKLWVPEVFFPAVLFPAGLFVLLYLYPFLDELFTFDAREHHVLRLPSEQPFNTAFGCGLIALLVVLEFAGGDDVVALAGNYSVVEIRAILRVLVFVLPVITWAISYALCRRARRRHQERQKVLTGSALADPDSSAEVLEPRASSAIVRD